MLCLLLVLRWLVVVASLHWDGFEEVILTVVVRAIIYLELKHTRRVVPRRIVSRRRVSISDLRLLFLISLISTTESITRYSLRGITGYQWFIFWLG